MIKTYKKIKDRKSLIIRKMGYRLIIILILFKSMKILNCKFNINLNKNG
jgi:hypothetical protein